MRLLFFALFLYACQSPTSNQIPVDSLNGQSEAVVRKHIMDSLDKDLSSKIYVGDTSNLSTSPIQILDVKPVDGDGGKNISITYKNVSGHPVSAIKFSWYGVDAFGDPTGTDKGYGSGLTDEPIEPGQTKTNVFEVNSLHLKRVRSTWPFEVAFEDGTKWKASK